MSFLKQANTQSVQLKLTSLLNGLSEAWRSDIIDVELIESLESQCAELYVELACSTNDEYARMFLDEQTFMDWESMLEDLEDEWIANLN